MPEMVFLVGMMGAGKSSVGTLLARRWGGPHVDTDDEVEGRVGMRVEEIFATRGEAAFRAEESRALALAASSRVAMVVSVGGGAVLDAANRALLRRAGTVVWLRATVDTLTNRVGDGAGRPLLAGSPVMAVARLDEARRPLYEEVADVVVDVDELGSSEVADLVEAGVRRACP